MSLFFGMTRLFENEDGTVIAPLALTETIRHETVRFVRVESPHPGRLARLDGSWSELDVPDELSMPGVRQCVRCRRLNFGPCISATCWDLQAPPAWLARLIDPRFP